MKKYELFPANQRGTSNIDWLDTKFSFSFAEYYNPERMGFGALRVINDDTIAPAKGFGMHSHQNMEIITIPFSGSLAHKDSMGNDGIITAGEVQSMSAGSGILHSEINPSPDTPVSLFQIWIETKTNNIAPQYSQKAFSPDERINTWQLLAQQKDSLNTVKINQDAFISRTTLKSGNTIKYSKYLPENIVYIMNISGEFQIDSHTLSDRDAIGINSPGQIKITSQQTSDILVIEIPR